MIARSIPVYTSLVILGACGRAPRRPNVVLISLDTTRADHLGCYGHVRQTSPRIDGLARQGLLFERAIAQAAVTPVSHASILTGLHPYSHGLRVMHGAYGNHLEQEHVTLAEVLLEAGWSTGAFVSAFPVSEYYGLEQGYQVFDSDFLVDAVEAIVTEAGGVNTGLNQRRGDHTTDRALAWLEEAPRPFHLLLHYFDPHDIGILPPDDVLSRHGDLPRRAGPRLERIYDIEIEFMDAQLGRVLDYLEDHGEREDTLVVLLADHGEGLGDHGWWSHGILYQEQVRVPLILAGPGVPADERSDALVRTIDVMPTVLGLCGLSDVPRTEGQDLLGAARGGSAPDLVAYCDSVNLMTYSSVPGYRDEKDDMLFAVVQGRWKYIHHLREPQQSELYDLVADPREENNLASENPALVERLRARAIAKGNVPEKLLEPSGISRETIERLESLGYFGDD